MADQDTPEAAETEAPYSADSAEQAFAQATGPTDLDPAGEATAPFAGDNGAGEEEKPPGREQFKSALDPDVLKRLDDANDRLMAEQGRFMRGGLADVEKMQQGMLARPQPQLEKMPEAPKANLTEGMMPFLQIASVLGALAGSRGRGNATLALTAFASSVKGFEQGRQDVFQAKMQEFKEASAKLKEENQQKLDQYNLAWRNDKLNIDQKMSMIKMISAQYGDEITHNLAVRKDYMTLAQALDKQQQFQMMYNQRERQMGGTLGNMERGGYTEEGLKSATDLYIDTGKLPSLGNRKDAAIVKQIIQNNAPIRMRERNLDPEQMVQHQQEVRAFGAFEARQAAAAGGRYGNIRYLSNLLGSQIDPVLELSESVQNKRGRFVPLNKLIQGGKVMTSDPDLADWATANLQLAETWAKAMNSTGTMRLEDRQIALQSLMLAQSPQAYRRVVERIRTFVNQEETTGKQLREQFGYDKGKYSKLTEEKIDVDANRDILAATSGRAIQAPAARAPVPTARGPSQSTDDGWGQVTVH